MIMVEYECPHHGRFDYLEDIEAQDDRPCPECENASPYVISAPSVKPNYGSVTQGKGDTERPKDFVSTSALADGMSVNEYKERLSKARKERIRQHVRSKI